MEDKTRVHFTVTETTYTVCEAWVPTKKLLPRPDTMNTTCVWDAWESEEYEIIETRSGDCEIEGEDILVGDEIDEDWHL